MHRLRPSVVSRPRALPVSFTLGLRFEHLLEVFGVNTRFGPLRLSHRRSLRSLLLNEIGFGRASGKNIQPRTFRAVGTSRLDLNVRLVGAFRRSSCCLSFLRLHFAFLLWNAAYHTGDVEVSDRYTNQLSGQPVAAAGAAEGDRDAGSRAERRLRRLLLLAVGGEPSDAAPI